MTTLIIGAGKSGVAAANFLAVRGEPVRLCDARTEENLPHSAAVDDRVEKHFGSQSLDLLRGAAMVILSPGVPATVPVVRQARDSGIPVISEIELAFRHMQGGIIAVTGSNGKSTTTALIAEILMAAGQDPVVAGNIGLPLISVVENRPRVYVVELSSFQLETVDTFRPDVAVLLNITPDHMDRYGSMEEYAMAKYRIFANQTSDDLAVVNAEDPLSANAPTEARLHRFSSRRKLSEGAWREGDDLVLQVGSRNERIPRAALYISGDANVENALASWLAVGTLGVERDAVIQAFGSFRGLPHRMRLVSTIRGAAYINDSKGTNVDATLRSLEGMKDSAVLLIVGGKDKNGEFERLRDAVKKKVRAVLAIGEAAGRIGEALKGCSEIVSCGDMRAAMEYALAHAREGDVVLLSPACASFDQYENFEKRGEHFEELVRGANGDGEERGAGTPATE